MMQEPPEMKREPQTDALQGKRVAFTGKLLTTTRAEARDIVRRAGGTPTSSVSRRTDLLVVGMGGWPLLPNGHVSSSLRRAEELNDRGGRILILSEERFLERVGLRETGPALEKHYSAEEISELTGIGLDKLRRWEQLGLVRSSEGRFDFQDLVTLRTLTDLVSRGVQPEVIHRSLRGLASFLPNTDRPLAQLRILGECSDSLVADWEGMRITSEGQLMLDFEEAQQDAKPTIGLPSEEPETAEMWLERGERHEMHEEFEAAAAAYREAAAAEPSSPEAYFNLGNVLRSMRRPDAALEMFRLAVAFEPEFSEAWYNIGDILEEEGACEEAIESLRHALRADPDFADAMYNLAACFEKLGRRQQAQRYWSQYLQLDATSDWARVAREHLAVP